MTPRKLSRRAIAAHEGLASREKPALSGLRFGWAGFGVLSLILTAAAVASMTGLTGLSLAGARWLGLQRAGRYEGAVLGAALVLLGLLVVVLER